MKIKKRYTHKTWINEHVVLCVFFCFFSFFSFSQVTSQIDTTQIRIGEQVNYKIKVEADSSSLVVFPEGQTFMPLESVEALEIDTTKKDRKLLLSRIYKLTQFDSGTFTIPKQKIIIDDKPFFTDSLKVTVNTIEVDTTKQKLYDIKPIIEVDKTGGNRWIWLLIILLILALVGLLLYWFIWREKPLTEEEEIALLPPYERAKLALTKLDESQYLMHSEIKTYYSELTLVIRKFLDEKVYDRSLESTTDELISRLQLLKEGNQFPFTKETIHNLESILKRADLVKFAKSAPDAALIELDRNTIENEIDNVKACLPEPSEEEKQLDQAYKEAQLRKKKRKKIIFTALIGAGLLVATFIGFVIKNAYENEDGFDFKYGLTYTLDTIFGNDTKALLEGEWVKSAYGYPPVYIETPEVLRRLPTTVPDSLKQKIKRTAFAYGGDNQALSIAVITTTALESGSQKDQKEVRKNVANSIEQILYEWEVKNVQNIITRGGDYTTPNGVEGIKTHGTADFPIKDSEVKIKGEYAIYSFATANDIMHVSLIWDKENDYTQDIVDRIINSIELKTDEQANAEKETTR